MVYSGITACLGVNNQDPDPNPKEVALLAEIEIMQAIMNGCLRELLEQEARAVIALMQKTERVEDLERQVKNLEWNLNRARRSAGESC